MAAWPTLSAESFAFWPDLIHKARYKVALGRLAQLTDFYVARQRAAAKNTALSPADNAALARQIHAVHGVQLIAVMRHHDTQALARLQPWLQGSTSAVAVAWQPYGYSVGGLFAQGFDTYGYSMLGYYVAQADAARAQALLAQARTALAQANPSVTAHLAEDAPILAALLAAKQAVDPVVLAPWLARAQADAPTQAAWGQALWSFGATLRELFFVQLSAEQLAAQLGCMARAAHGSAYLQRQQKSHFVPPAWFARAAAAALPALAVVLDESSDIAIAHSLLSAVPRALVLQLTGTLPAAWQGDATLASAQIYDARGLDNVVIKRALHSKNIGILIDLRAGAAPDATGLLQTFPCPIQLYAGTASMVAAGYDAQWCGGSIAALPALLPQLWAAWCAGTWLTDVFSSRWPQLRPVWQSGQPPTAQLQAQWRSMSAAQRQNAAAALLTQASQANSSNTAAQQLFGNEDLLLWTIQAQLPFRYQHAMVGQLLLKAHRSLAAAPMLATLRLDEPAAQMALHKNQIAVGNALGQYRSVFASTRKALKLEPRNAELWAALGNVATDMGYYPLAISAYERALSLEPANGLLLYNIGRAQLYQGQLQPCLAYFTRAELLTPGAPSLLMGFAFAQLTLSQWRAGWRAYESRYKLPELANMTQRKNRWQGEEVNGKTVLITHEQGFGDSIMFARYAIELAKRGATILLVVQGRLTELCAQWVGRWGKGQISQILPDNGLLPSTDYWTTALSIPHFLNLAAPKRSPYLQAPPCALPQASQGTLKVGLVWGGAPDNGRDRLRSMPWAKLAPLLALSATHKVQFYSLQMGEAYDAVRDLPGFSTVVDLAPQTHSFKDTAAQIAALDLVISVDTAVRHIAGAMDKPVWMLLDQSAEWRNGTLTQKHNAFYQNTTHYRQQGRSQWARVVAQVCTDLQAVLAGTKALPKAQTIEQPAPLNLSKAPAPALNTQPMGQWLAMTHSSEGKWFNSQHDQAVSQAIRSRGVYGAMSLKLQRSLLEPTDVMVEVGAGFGGHSIPMARHLSRGAVYAFEPQRELNQLLVSNGVLNELTNLHTIAAVAHSHMGRTKVSRFDMRQASNLTAVSLGNGIQGEDVAVRTVDSLALPRLRLLKVNIAENTLPILQGGQTTITRDKPLLWLARGGEAVNAQTIAWLKQHEYAAFWFKDHEFTQVNNPSQQFRPAKIALSANIIAIAQSELAAVLEKTKTFDLTAAPADIAQWPSPVAVWV